MAISEERKKHLALLWNSSRGISMAEFCRQNKTNNRSLMRWVRKYGGESYGSSSDAGKDLDGDLEITLTGNTLAISKGSEIYYLNKKETPDRYRAILNLWTEGDKEAAWKMADIREVIRSATEGEVSFNDGRIYYCGREIHGGFVGKVVRAAKLGDQDGVSKWLKFTDSLVNLEDATIVEDIVDFLSRIGADIDDDGDIIAYKGCNEDGWDWYTGKTFFHQVGAELKMPRFACTRDRNNACSRGIHFGSKDYAAGFSGALFKVKIKPSDIVSVTYDGNGEKGRCCRLLIIEKVDKD